MNKFKMLVSATLASAFLSTTALAAGSNPDQVVNKTAQPIKAFAPSDLPRKYLGETIRVCMDIDEEGRPSNIALDDMTERELSRSVIDAVAQWRFAPAEKDGQPVAQRVIMPVEFVVKS